MNTEFLKELGLEQEVIDKLMAENGKDIAKEKQKTETASNDLKTAKKSIADYEQQIINLKGSASNAEDLQFKITSLEKQIKDREETDRQAAADKAFADRFSAVTECKEFLNDFTKNGVLSEFKDAISDKANAGKSDADIFTTIVKDRDGIFANGNPSPPNFGGNGGKGLDGDDNQNKGLSRFMSVIKENQTRKD